jgi:hypothetical protein
MFATLPAARSRQIQTSAMTSATTKTANAMMLALDDR